MLVVGHAREEVMAPGRDVGILRPLLSLKRHVALLLPELEIFQQDRHALTGRVLESESDEDETDTEIAQLIPGDRVLLVLPFERRRVVERKARPGKALADLPAELLCRSALRGRKLTPQKVWDAAVQIPKPAIDGELDAPLALWSFGGGDTVGPRDDDEVAVAEVVGRVAHHPELAHELVGRDERLARDVAAPLGHHLVFEVRRRNSGTHVEVDRGHRQLEPAQRADRAASAVSDLDRRVDVHVGGAEMTDGERIAAEIHRVEAVVHDQLGAERVVHAWAKDIGPCGEEPAQAAAGVLVARRRDFVALRQERRGYQIHETATRSRGRSCMAPGTRIRTRLRPGSRAPATTHSFP